MNETNDSWVSGELPFKGTEPLFSLLASLIVRCSLALYKGDCEESRVCILCESFHLMQKRDFNRCTSGHQIQIVILREALVY